MAYATLMVNLDLTAPNQTVLAVAARLAAQFKAHVIGIAAAQPVVMAYGDGYVAGELIEQDRATTATESAAAEALFRVAMRDVGAGVEWRTDFSYTLIADYVARNARSADLVITGPSRGNSLMEPSRHADVGELVLQAGRPVLVVPDGVAGTTPGLDHVMVAWKEGREARRALVDALPLLRAAARVTLVSVVAERDRDESQAALRDVAAWLGRHDVAAHPLVELSDGDDALRLDAVAERLGAGLMVAGAYGKSRLREWVMGGVTREALLHPGRCTLLSH